MFILPHQYLFDMFFNPLQTLSTPRQMRRIRDPRLHLPAYPVGNNPAKAVYLGKMMADILRELYPTNDLILIGRGSSGNILCSMIAAHTVIYRIIDIKKEGTDSHEYNHCVNFIGANNPKYIVIDDLVNLGDTMKAIFMVWNSTNLKSPINTVMVGGCVGSVLPEFSSLEYLISTS